MVEVKKKSTPQILIEKQKIAREQSLNSAEAYKLLNHAEKELVLASLMEEQGHVCAYCMRRIPDEREMPETIDPVTIEHWYPRKPRDGGERGQGLDYNNMLAVCSGNRGKRGTRHKGDLTCDAKRDQNHPQLTLNPCDPTTLCHIKYKEDGVMDSGNEAVKDDINVKLNLNCSVDAVQLPQNRKAVLEALQSEIPQDDESALRTSTRCLMYSYGTE